MMIKTNTQDRTVTTPKKIIKCRLPPLRGRVLVSTKAVRS